MLPTLIALCFLAPQQHHRKAAPFDAVRWDEAQPIVRVDGTWYEWVAIDDVPVDEIVAYCQRTWPRVWQKRVGEDLCEALAGMDVDVGDEVTLDVRLLETGEERTLEGVSMTRAKRESAEEYNDRHDIEQSPRVEPVERNRSSIIPGDDARRDLTRLRELIQQKYSYRDRLGVDLTQLFEEAEAGIEEFTSRSEFAVIVMKILARFGDGHTRLASSLSYLPRGYLPAGLATQGERVVALRADGRRLLDEEAPYLVGIDGRPLDEWLAAVRPIVPDGSNHGVRFKSLDRLGAIAFARQQLGLESESHVTFELEDLKGVRRTVRREVAARPANARQFGTRRTTIRDGIGILRIPSMDSGAPFRASLHEAMAQFEETEGLILDLRGNGGGSREALRTLFPYFLEAGEARVVNVAACRIDAGALPVPDGGYLDSRFCFLEEYDGWNEDEHAAVAECADQFQPEWTPPAGEFSDWHYCVLSTKETPNHRTYGGQVVVLLDSGCFSATDIFLGAFKGHPRVTLMGEPSSGGSGRSRTHRLPTTGLEVRLSSMASYRPDGRLYEGAGIQPDILAIPTVDDLNGTTDSVLERAIAHLKGG